MGQVSLPSYFNCVSFLYYAQLTDKLSHCSYMFRHYRVILRELVDSTLLSYTSMSMQSLVIQFKISHVLYAAQYQCLKSLKH